MLQATLSSEWDGLICLNYHLDGADHISKKVSDLIIYDILEGSLTEDTIYITRNGPVWSDVFEGLDSDITSKVYVRVNSI